MLTSTTLAITMAATATIGAQDAKVIQQDIQRDVQREVQRIVIGPEVRESIRKAIDAAIGQELATSISREIVRDVQSNMQVLTQVIGGNAYTGTAFNQSKDFKAEQTDRQTKTLAIGATGVLTLNNVVGDIVVKTGSGKDVTVEIVRISRGKTDADARAGLDKVVPQVETRGDRGSVSVQYPNDPHPTYAVSVAYNVTAPAGTSVKVETIAGHVSVTGLQGELSTNGISGGVDVKSCARVRSVHAVSGNIVIADSQSDDRLDVGSLSSTVTLTNIKARRLSAGVISAGIVAQGIQVDDARLTNMSGPIEFTGSLTPKGRYEFQSQNGQVKLAVTGGFDLEARTFSGKIDVDPSVNLKTDASANAGPLRRTTRGVAGDGGATVVATSFSGNIWIGRK